MTEKDLNSERVFEGLGVSPGIGIGYAYVRESGIPSVPEYHISLTRIDDERARFKAAVTKARRQIGRLRTKAKTLPGAASEELCFLLDAYSQMLKNSRLVRGVDKRIGEARLNAEAAVLSELTEISKSFQAMDDAYLAARLDDIREVANRLIRNLIKTPFKPFSQAPKGSIVAAEELTPADTAQLDPYRITGIATALGGAEGHTAIMARALELPAVLGAPGLLESVKPGETVIVDGSKGRIIVNPTATTMAAYEKRQREYHDEIKRLTRLRDKPAITRDGVTISLMANVELPLQLSMVARSGAQGIGLLRTEFMFMNRDDIPGEEEQYLALRDLIEGLNGAPMTVRTLDVGGEKTAPAIVGEHNESASSALGLRGIRLSLARPDLLEAQFRAILRAGVHGPIRILLPMVTSLSEVRHAREVLKKSAKKLKRKHIPFADPLPPLGVMIEVPGAALSSDALAQASDFLAIGSNDLTMYTLAADRADEQVAHLFNPLHPAVLRLIEFTAQAGLRASIPVSICGEMAGDPRYTALLLGLGLRELSMSAANVPRVKQRIRNMDLVAAGGRAHIIMDQVDAGRIAMLLDDFNALA